MDATSPVTDRLPLTLSWQHPAGMAKLSILNFLMKVVTLGIYGFWAKTEVRKRIWSGVRLNGEPLTYTGTGKELFIGFLIILGAVIIPTGLLSIAVIVMAGQDSMAANVFFISVYLLFGFLWGVAFYRAQRYRLSRTVWRGIRGSLVGSDMKYAWTFFWTGLLIPLTLGWIIPWRALRLQTLMMNDTWFGDRPFTFEAASGPLYKRFAQAWFGFVAAAGALYMTPIGLMLPQKIMELSTTPTVSAALMIILIYLGALALLYLIYAIPSAWYRAHQANYFASQTQFEGATFTGTQTGAGLLQLTITNWLISTLSLGLFLPVAMARTARYQVSNLQIVGDVPLASVSQGADQEIQRGEGLAQAFDFDAF
jgi:uncharacterized membrane protein YjgN (DUF898 family)